MPIALQIGSTKSTRGKSRALARRAITPALGIQTALRRRQIFVVIVPVTKSVDGYVLVQWQDVACMFMENMEKPGD
jgi:hypothetical protein